MARSWLLLLWLLASLVPITAAHAGGPSPRSSSGCDPSLPPELGGCGAGSPYMEEVQAGISGFGPFVPPQPGQVSGWIEILNTGPAMPHLIVEVNTGGSFAARNIYAAFNTGRQRYRRAVRWLGPPRSPFLWDFGRFPAGAVAIVHFGIHLANGCSYRMDLRAYGDVTSGGGVNRASAVWGSGFGESGGAGNCPIPGPAPERS